MKQNIYSGEVNFKLKKMPSKKVCRVCLERRALFRFRGVVKWDKHHSLCFRCFRSQANRLREIIRAEESARKRTSVSGKFGFAGN